MRHNTLKQPRPDREFSGLPLPPSQPLLVSGGVMKDYQLAGLRCSITSVITLTVLRWLASLRKLGANGILADEMGLGKTLQTIALFCHVVGVRRRPGPFLVIAPLSTIANWLKEVARFAPGLPASVLYPAKEAKER